MNLKAYGVGTDEGMIIIFADVKHQKSKLIGIMKGYGIITIKNFHLTIS